jgi:hypothetical protein
MLPPQAQCLTPISEPALHVVYAFSRLETMSDLTERDRMFLPIPAADRQQALEFAAQQVTAASRQ